MLGEARARCNGLGQIDNGWSRLGSSIFSGLVTNADKQQFGSGGGFGYFWVMEVTDDLWRF